MQRIPDGWTPEQLQALNDLAEAVAAYQLLNYVMDQSGDTSPKAQALRASMFDHAKASWLRLKQNTPSA